MGYNKKVWVLIYVSMVFLGKTYGCTDFVVETKDGTLINGRSLEFAIDLKTTLKVFPKNTQFSSKSPNQAKGIEWTSKYGHLSATILGMDICIDGLNEKGLSFGYLWLPGTQYMDVAKNETVKAIDFMDFGNWILGNFSTVAELKKALPQVLVWGHPIPSFPGGTPPAHVAVHDRMGNHLVIEFIQGEIKIYDNPNTVLTNYPPFDWHLINLQNYIGLNALNAAPIEWKGMNLAGTGQGSGFLGMPGDWTPPSRFIRMSTLLRFAKTAKDKSEGVNLVEHLLNAVDIPIGDIQARDGEQDYTQWVVIKDLTNQAFYFRSYKNLAMKLIDLKKLDFRPGKQQESIPIDISSGFVDITPQ